MPLLGAACLLFTALDRASLERAEIYFLDAARAMVESGDWLVPRYRGEPFFDKPALTYWLMAAAMKAIGPSATAGRAVSALAGLGLLVVTAWLGRRLLDDASALAGATILATTLAFMSFGRIAMADMLLAFFSTLAVALGVRAWPAPAAAWLAPALGLTLGLGFLTKGPIALLLPGLGLLALAFWRRRELWPFRPAALALGCCLAVASGLGWFALVYKELGAEPLRHFFLRENLKRFAASTYDTGRSPFFYLGAYLLMGAPWSLFLPSAIGRAVRPRSDGMDMAGVRFLLGWVLLMLVPLSLSRGKLDYYLLPLLPALSLALGRFFVATPWRARDRAAARVALLLLAVAVAASLLLLGRIDAAWVGPWRRLGLQASAALAALVLVAAAWRCRPRVVLGALAGVSAGMALAYTGILVPGFLASQPNARIVQDVQRVLARRPSSRVVVCEDPTRVQRDILFEARTAVEERCDLWAVASGRRPAILLVPETAYASLRQARMRVRGRYRYLPATALTLASAGRAAPARLFLLTNEHRHRPMGMRRRSTK